MIKMMFKPFFKKYLGLFISMAFVSMLSIALLCTFGSTVVNLQWSYSKYLVEYGDIDEQISTNFASREYLVSIADQIEEVQYVDARITLDAYMRKPDGRTIVSRIFTFNEAENRVFKRYILDSIPASPNHVNISICRKFAANNNIKLGQTVEIGYFNMFLKFYVNEIVETAEGIYPRANDYIWSDNQDFGYMYIDEAALNTALLDLAEQVKQKIAADDTYKQYYDEIIAVAGITMPDLRTIDVNFVPMFANQLLVRNYEGDGSQVVLNKILAKLQENGVAVKSSTTGENLPYRLYMSNAIKQLTIAAIFLPVFFYSVTMVVIGLFMNQIIKSMTPEIGVLMSIGIDQREIVGLFMIFGLLMASVAGIFGCITGYGLNALMSSILVTTYSLPTLHSDLFWGVVVMAILILLVFAELATFLSCLAIFRITPKDATISNESKRKNLPRWLSKVIDHSPMNIKLGLYSIAQNPKRFFVSTFSIFASLTLILLSTNFYVAKNEMIAQSVERRLSYDCQVYLTQRADAAMVQDLGSQPFVDDMADCLYTYVKAQNGDNAIYLECLGVSMDAGPLVNIPDSSGRGDIKVQEQGIILPKSDAERLGVWAGSQITLNDHLVTITDISYQYFHPITYMSRAQMNALDVASVVSSFLMNINDEQAFLSYLSDNNNQCLTVFTRSLSMDLHAIFNAVDIFIYIMVGFSLGMSFVILSIMSQNALMEQKRQLSVQRAIGFTIMDISNFWTLQSVLQILSSAFLGIPSGVGFSIILFKLCSSSSQIYPFIFSWPVIGLALLFVTGVVVICHLIAMLSIKRWNLADNTRCRE